MARYSVRLVGGPPLGWDTGKIYQPGQFIPQSLANVIPYARVQQGNIVRNAVRHSFFWESPTFIEDTRKILSETEGGPQITVDNSAFYRLFVQDGPLEKGLVGLYRQMMKELVAEYRVQIPANRLRETEEGWRVGPVGGSRSRVTGKIYRHIGGNLIKDGSRTVGISFPDASRLENFQWRRLEVATKWIIPAGNYFDGKYYPWWMREQFMKDAGIKPIPRIKGGLSTKEEKKAVRKREALRDKNANIMERKGVSSFGTRETKMSKPQKPLEKAWNKVMGPKGENVEKRIGVKIEQVLTTNIRID